MNDFDCGLQVEDSSDYCNFLAMQELDAWHEANRLTPDDLDGYASAFDLDISLELV